MKTKTMFSKILAWTLTLAMMLSVLPGMMMPVSASTMSDGTFSGGLGTQAAPYLIATVEDLTNLRTRANSTGANGTNPAGTLYRNAHYMQIADIDLTGTPWTPIGTSTTAPFGGVYDGGNYNISNMSMSPNNSGLFNAISGATLRNINLMSINIGNASSTSYTGGVVNRAQNSSRIENIFVSGNITINSTGIGDIGGVVGAMEGGGTLQNCRSAVVISITTFTGSSTGTLHIGGIVEIGRAHV